MFEYQTAISELTGLPVSNASVYEGPSAVAAAAYLAKLANGKPKVVVSRAVHPHARAALRTLAAGYGHDVVEVGLRDGVTDAQAWEQAIDDQTGAAIVAQPNFLGAVEDVEALATAARAAAGDEIVVIGSYDPIPLGILRPPGEVGVDVAVGEGQSLGNRLDFGGPSFGFFAATQAYLRRMPGRIAGETRDVDGRRGFVLTLQTREQHIRREKATSNICTNVALCALMATIYVAILGKRGLRKVGELSTAKAHYAARELTKIPGVRLRFAAPFFKEFTLQLPKAPERVIKRLLKDRVLAGVPLKGFDRAYKDCLLVAVTEKRTREEIDAYAAALAAAVA